MPGGGRGNTQEINGESLQEKWHVTASMGGATNTRYEDRVKVEARHRMGMMEVKRGIGACQGHGEG